MSAGGLFPSIFNFFLQWLNIRGLHPIWFIVEILLFFKSIMNGLFIWFLSWQLHYWNIAKFLSSICLFSVKIFATFLKMIRKPSFLIKPIIGCFKCEIMSSANVNNLNSLSCFYLFSSSCFIALKFRDWNEYGCVLFWMFEEIAFYFSHLMNSMGLHLSFVMLRYASPIPCFSGMLPWRDIEL